ncbi:hypothetical protein BH23ACT3_BH23ACT3_13380 [soil metagenome]
MANDDAAGPDDRETDRATTEDLRHTVERVQHELSELREANEVLSATHATVQILMEVTDASVFAKDLEGRYIFVNPRGAQIVGLQVSGILGRTDAEQTARFQAHFDEVVSTRRPVSRLMPIPLPSGTEMWASNVVPLVDADGEIYGVAGIATDVTERARREVLLRQRTRQLEAAQRIAKLGTWSWDPGTGRLEISDELTRILGGSPGRRWAIADLESITHPDDLTDAIDAVRAARRGHDVDHLFRVRRPDGAVGWLRLRSDSNASAPSDHVDKSDDPGDVVLGTIQDVTEREEAEHRRAELERRLQQSQRLETVGQLAGGVAHDFNNLLAVIGMQAELATQSLTIDHTSAHEHLRELQETIDRASALTRQLLVFSRHEGYDDAVIDIQTSLTALGPILGRSLGTHIDLVIDIAPDLHPIEADRSQIEQVLVDLSMNARHAMPDGGTVTIEGRNVVSDHGDLVRLTVSDTGVGMPPEHVERAFEPFCTTKPPGVGTGLGLSTVHGIVTRSGGTVELRSEPGHGVTVEILLPASIRPVTTVTTDTTDDTDDRDAPDAPDGASTSPRGERTVLIVEDLEPLGELAATVLGRAGYRTVVATSGPAALALVADHLHVDLLLTDVVMPGMTGRELSDRLREIHPGIPTIFMTGYTGGMLELGDHDEVRVISKPFTAAELVAAVNARFSAP